MQKNTYRYHFFQGRIFSLFQKGRYFTVYKLNQRLWEPQTLCVYVDAKACSSSTFCVAPATIHMKTLYACEN